MEHPPMKGQVPPASSTGDSFPLMSISIIGIISTAVVLVIYYVFVSKSSVEERGFIELLSISRSRRRRWLNPDPMTAYVPSAERRGLEEAVIRGIPIFQFKMSGFLRDCVVCLSGFEEGERLRQLPRCSHVFHIDCIDVWLQNSVKCPICRLDIACGGLAKEERESNFDCGGGGIRPVVEPSIQQQDTVPAAERGRFKKVRSIGDECIDVRSRKEDRLYVQPMRRSFSMDSSDGHLHLSIRAIASEEGSSSVPTPPWARRLFFSFGRSSQGGSSPNPP
ncbi:unnamed protein product [Spirodela intermedia]|uniref:RING-type E3 ubiquitin transferase n=1 Tax=Spirodela intermedia TaxID=51605 RepID=A0A7I8K1G1_SPIIN|nr:unnamed protein product [Spirodela intermedia]